MFTSSWDDGHPMDLRVADLLARHGFGATFFVPSTNSEGLPVMTASEIRTLHACGFEIGSHTLDHHYLNALDDRTARSQINQGKVQIEDLLGRSVAGFCYPGGKYGRRELAMVREAGFWYARDIAGYFSDIDVNPFSMHVSLQLFPHKRLTYFRNFLRHRRWNRRRSMWKISDRHADLPSRLRGALDLVCTRGGVFHLWGHSWEMDVFDGWTVLDDFLSYAAARIPSEMRLSNLEVLRRTLGGFE